MKRDPKQAAQSITAKLTSLASKEGVPFPRLLTTFLLERLAVRLSSVSSLSSALVFKGGYVAFRVYDSPRFTIDLDAVIHGKKAEEVIESAIAVAQQDIDDGVWFQYESRQNLTTQNEYGGVRTIFRVGLGERPKKIQKAQTVNLDFGIGDPVTPRPVENETPFLLGGGRLSWRVYPVETMVAEKLHSLLSKGDVNSRAKDVYDLSLFIEKCDRKKLKAALDATFEYRKTEFPDEPVSILRALNTDVLKRGWRSAVLDIGVPAEFEDVFSKVISDLSKVI